MSADAPARLRVLVDEELRRRHAVHAAHCDGDCLTDRDCRDAATIAVALRLIDARDALGLAGREGRS